MKNTTNRIMFMICAWVIVVALMGYTSGFYTGYTISDERCSDSIAEQAVLVEKAERDLKAMQEQDAKHIKKIKQLENTVTELEKVKGVMVSNVSWYCSCSRCTGAHTVTATGEVPEEGTTVAVDPEVIPLGSEVYIQGIGWRIAEDVGGGIKNNGIDVYVASHEVALQNGRQELMALWR